jgi:hypothetical protein
MATPAQFPSEVAQRIYALLKANKVSLLTADGMVLYGDQNRVPVTPTLCVEAGATTRVLAGVAAGGRTENQHICYLLLYYAKVDSNQETKLACEQTAEAIARFLDQNLTLELNSDGGIVIHGYVSNIDPGYSFKNKGETLMYSVRLTWTGKTKTILGA